ncbi:probable xyloglucan galactosyltransferase GT17 [Punica granatum]|uniref:Exostosin GT47 domain-containing protein n=2 Tax=Punica granatum TaxID=22663 RepID=A0A218W278_PUNGR|nr:probable xyloglucan galactosyltransferase GT17 [Punica granatum]OWM66937.1 hypothetical protein CDL15_Pgr008106 [Punica granatum]PKI36297.1 hypothetical protein CRG98_043323 [Punica granatum]
MAASLEKPKYTRPRTAARWKHGLLLALFLALWFLLLIFRLQDSPAHQTKDVKTNAPAKPDRSPATLAATCDGGDMVYIYELPPKFNFGLLNDCRRLNIYMDMCPHVANRGLGQPVAPVLGPGRWHATHQFIGEMIFHARMERHPCRTNDPARAHIFYVPFYGGLYASSKFREQDLRSRDELAVELAEYLQGFPWWQRHGGRDHFLALGRTAWDFMRKSNQGPDFGANVLLDLPAIKNMSVLTVERQPWSGLNQYGMPYPSYFHPTTLDQMLTWQDKVRQSERPYLFSFIGGPRKGLEKAAVRDELIKQCAESSQCRLMKCVGGDSKCHSPVEILKAMMSSRFCLQAPGDSFTRRSTFDSVLAGCIPVFFSRHTAYTQYMWFLPEDHSEYSVYVDAESGGALTTKIEDVLSKISAERVEKMRSKVVELIPRLTYAHPNATNLGFKDAVDVALETLARHVKSELSSLS